MSNLNGGIVLPNRQEQHVMAANMRLQIASAVLPELAALDYQRAYAQAISEEDPLGTRGGEDVVLNLKLNPQMVCQAACIYAETLMVMHGIPMPQPEKEPRREATEFEKAVNR